LDGERKLGTDEIVWHIMRKECGVLICFPLALLQIVSGSGRTLRKYTVTSKFSLISLCLYKLFNIMLAVKLKSCSRVQITTLQYDFRPILVFYQYE
jgi:hypothetical protein